MRITLGNIDGKALGLNASEACVYAAIEKCSRGDNAKGWYGTMEALAGVLPCKINRMSVSRAIAKLLNLGLIIEMENKYFVNAQTLQNTLQTLQNTLQNSLHNSAQNVQNDAQNVHENAQNVHENAQNVLPPNNPPINKEEKMEASNSCTHTQARDAAKPQSSENLLKRFEALKRRWINAGGSLSELNQRITACWSEWRMMSEPKRVAIEEALNWAFVHKLPPDHWKDNPLFFLRDFPEPEPKDYNGARLLPNEPLVIAKYNDRAGLYARREAELFGMNILRPFKP